MRIKNFNMTKLNDSLYGSVIPNIDNDAIYCEMKFQRDRSSFAGMALKITSEKNVIAVKECQEKIVQDENKYEKLYIGCDQDYVNSIKNIFSQEGREYGIEVLFLVYSDIHSSQIIFEELIKNVLISVK